MPVNFSSVDLSVLLNKISKLKVMVVGDVMVDEYLIGNAQRISPEAPVPVVAIEERRSCPGGAANVALNILQLGATPILCSVIGQDAAAKTLLSILKKNKIKAGGILSSKDRVTSVKTRVLSKNHQLLRYDSEMTADLTEKEEQMFLSTFRSILDTEKPDAVILEDYNKGILTPKVIREIILACGKKNLFVAVDPKNKNFFAYQSPALFKPNQREIQEAFREDIDFGSENSLRALHQKLKRKLSHRITLLTLGEKGIYFDDGKESGMITAQPRDVSDVSGAGDTVIAVATLCLVAGLPLKDAAFLANIAGGLVCEHSGVVPVTMEMLESELKS